MDKGMNRLEGEMYASYLVLFSITAFKEVFVSASAGIKIDIQENHLKLEVEEDILTAPKNN